MFRGGRDTDGILQGIRSGDRESLNDLFLRHRSKLLRMTELRLDPRLRGRLEPEDILQEAWLRALRRLDEYLRRPGIPFFLWISTLTMETLVDFHRLHLKAKARDVRRERRLWPAHSSRASSHDLARSLVARAPPPEVELERREAARSLWKAVLGMSEVDREVLILRHFQGLTSAETATVLEIEPATARQRHRRALERLADALVARRNGNGREARQPRESRGEG